MADQAIATAADYADAMLTARRAKNAIVLLLLLMVLLQIGLFFAARYDWIHIAAAPGDAPATASTQPAMNRAADLLIYLIGATAFLGVTLSIVLSFVLLLIVAIMLVGRLIGVARLTSSFIWCLILIVLLFPWQAFLANATFTNPDFKLPGVLYTFDELRQYAHFPNDPLPGAILKWARFVGFPLLAAVILFSIQVKSNRGIRQAFGEYDEAPLDRAATGTTTTTVTQRSPRL